MTLKRSMNSAEVSACKSIFSAQIYVWMNDRKKLGYVIEIERITTQSAEPLYCLPEPVILEEP